MRRPVGAAQAVALIVAAATGCSVESHPAGELSDEEQDYRFCVERGGDFHKDGWDGSYSCDMPEEG